ncbi:sodium/hydrogen exchanger 3-like isoform X2 [Ctenocephalides felis]|uniref:sodium/hydrogen exchanger 3-like isoform X2 n=1 Tax=Ctenocephalides felis TaxID=7515 RepID=UPI000E6E261B|nr:sodium/hydrogen exchanger 3-like isoform X2 [Ctenocephalides felis]
MPLRHSVNLSRRACCPDRKGGFRGVKFAHPGWCLFLVVVFAVNTLARPEAASINDEGRQLNAAPVVSALDSGKGDQSTGRSTPSESSTTSASTTLSSSTTTFEDSSDVTPVMSSALSKELGAHDGDAHAHALDGHHKAPPDSYPIITIEFIRVQTPFIIGLWILFASLAKIAFHMAPNVNKIFPESCLLIVVGVIIGVALFYATNVQVSTLTPDTFFLYMLPPIILDAGYFMPNRLFFDHLGTILLFAVIGTIFNILTIGVSLWACGITGLFGVETPLLDMFLFSSLISAVDPVAVLAVFEEIHVNEVLYIVVFGESLLNDAVTVVLYHMFETYGEMGASNIEYTDVLAGLANFLVVAGGGTIIGIIWGFATGLVTRYTHEVRVIEPIFIFVMAYLAYLNAEIFHMSGILAITFCGITMKNYVEANISHKSHTTIKYAMKMLSSSSETIIFMFLGVATINDSHDWNTWFVLLTVFFCSFFRICGVVILTALANRFRLHKLNRVEKFVMSYGGLRGAVAFALVLLIDPRHVKLQPMFVTTTIAVIYFTVFLQGITIKPLVRILNVKRAEPRKPTMNERIHERFMDHLMAGIEDILGRTGNYHVRGMFKRFDNKFIRPYLLRDHKGAEPKILETYSKLAMKDAMEYMRRNASTIGNISGTESMSAIFRNYTAGNLNANSPSFSQLDSSTWNIDMQELEYNPSKKDLTDAKIHHLLAEELCKPYRRHRRLSYSRHAVDDRDLSTQVNYRTHMNIRRMVGERKHHKRSKRVNKDGTRQNHVSFPEFQQNGSAKQFSHDYLNEVLHEQGEDEDTLTMDKPIEFSTKKPNGCDKPSDMSIIMGTTNKEDFDCPITFTAKSPKQESAMSPDRPVKRISRDSEGEPRVSTPTATESVLPWKRGDESDEGALQQSEFPAWASNKEYLAYNSPSATFLGGLAPPKQVRSVIGLFRKDSGASGSDTSLHRMCVDHLPPIPSGRQLDNVGAGGRSQSVVQGPEGRDFSKRSHSIAYTGDNYPELGNPGDLISLGKPATVFPVTASHRRQNRRGSMLELSGLIVHGRRPSRHNLWS